MQLRKSKTQGRNEACACGSGLKNKWCCGDEKKKAICTSIAIQAMAELVNRERINKGVICKHGILKDEHCVECKIDD